VPGPGHLGPAVAGCPRAFGLNCLHAPSPGGLPRVRASLFDRQEVQPAPLSRDQNPVLPASTRSSVPVT
jgi:hypothetical protein